MSTSGFSSVCDAKPKIAGLGFSSFFSVVFFATDLADFDLFRSFVLGTLVALGLIDLDLLGDFLAFAFFGDLDLALDTDFFGVDFERLGLVSFFPFLGVLATFAGDFEAAPRVLDLTGVYDLFCTGSS